MLPPTLRPTLLLTIAMLACTPQDALPPGKGRPRSGPAFDAAPVATAPTPTPTPTPTPVDVKPVDAKPVADVPTGTHPCDAAHLQIALAPDSVVAKVDGKDVLASELGADVKQAEAQAQRKYCDAIAQIREGALDNLIDERLLAKAAGGGDGQSWFRTEVEKLVKEPTDADITAFYEQNKSDEAPPLEMVREQVANEILRERSQTAAQRVLDRLRKAAEIEQVLPVVRLPPPDLSDGPSTAGFGPKGAAVHVVEFSDFECPYCARAAEPIHELQRKYGDRVRFSFRHFPLSFHPNARPAAEMAQCAEAQDKFWAFHDAVFARSSALADGGVRAAAEDAGLDLGKLDACLASGEAAKQVEEDLRLAMDAGVSGTPSFFLDGKPFEGGPGELSAAIEKALQKQG